MSQLSFIGILRFWRLAASAVLAVSMFAATAGATARVELFQAQAPVDGRSEAAQTAAFQTALRMVLVRVTGRRNADEEAVFAPLVTNARRYVQQYRTAPDNQVWVAFDGVAIERWLTQNGQPLWGRDRPATLVWLVVQPGPQGGSVVSAEDTSELKQAVDAAAAARGIPLIWPSAAVAASGGAPSDAVHRLGADALLAGRANGVAADAVVRWNLAFQDRSAEASGATEGVNRAADLFAGLYAASGSIVPVDIEIAGIADLRDYAGVQGYLESLTFVTHVGVQSLRGDTVGFRLATRGGIEPLAHAIALSGRLQPLPAGEHGVQRFQLRR